MFGKFGEGREHFRQANVPTPSSQSVPALSDADHEDDEDDVQSEDDEKTLLLPQRADADLAETQPALADS